jgi:hypothetical protein
MHAHTHTHIMFLHIMHASDTLVNLMIIMLKYVTFAAPHMFAYTHTLAHTIHMIHSARSCSYTLCT